MTERPELVSRATRRAFREVATGTVLREIDEMWKDEGFSPGPPPEGVGGERRNLYQSYLDAVDWTDPGHVRRALKVFAHTAEGYAPDYLKRAYKCLALDGYEVTEDGRIVGGPPELETNRSATVALPEHALANLTDPSAIREGLDRIERAVVDDPPLAIGGAKELIESTAKVVLHERGRSLDEKADLPQLVKEAQEALLLHPSQKTVGPDGSEAVKRILGGAISMAIGVAELRNRGYGTGHGPARARVGLGPRHAQLAVGAALTWCQLMLDTLADPAAPWRRANTEPSE